MKRGKTSKAKLLTARLNPINPAEASALRILDERKTQGFNFKQVAVDAINRAAGVTPEMIGSSSQLGSFTRVMENLLQEFSEKLLNSGAFNGAPHEQEARQNVSKFTSNFVKGLKERQQSSEEDD